MTTENRVAILTLHWSNNYGACYQSYALQAFLENNGYIPQILDYRMESVNLSNIMQRPIVSLQKIYQKQIFKWTNVKNWLQRRRNESNDSNESNSIFDQFRDGYLNISSEELRYEDLTATQNQFEAYIVGSDQVWAADFEFTSDAYILGFVDRETFHGKLVSYAASFGKSSLEPYLRPIFRQKLANFDAVSCRETSGCEIVEHVAHRDVHKVVDPTLLISDYSKITSYASVPEAPYLLVYVLPQDDSLSAALANAVEYYSREMQLDVRVVAPEGCHSSLAQNVIKPTPQELLGLIEKCSFLATNSFHGTVFGIIFEVPFVVFARDSFSNKQNVRMQELLRSVGLYDRFIEPFCSHSDSFATVNSTIDFAKAKAHLTDTIENSSSFLLGALKQ